MATTVIAATYGILPEFDPDSESVNSYTARATVFSRLTQFLKTNRQLFS